MPDGPVSGFTTDAAPTADDAVYIINDPAGTPGSRKAILSDLFASSPFIDGVFDQVDTDGTLAANSDAVIPSQKAVKTYVDSAAPSGAVLVTSTTVQPGGNFWDFVLDEDTLTSNSDTKLPTQQSVKAYVDTNAVTTGATSTAGWAFVLDEDDMVSNSATKLPTQQSTKAYVDNLSTLTTSDTGKVPITTTGGVTIIDVDDLLTAGDSDFADGGFTVHNTADDTKILAFDVSAISAATTRTYAWPNADGTVVLAGSTQTLTNKTLTSPTVNSPTISFSTLSVSTSSSIPACFVGGASDITFTANRAAFFATGGTWTMNGSGISPSPMFSHLATYVVQLLPVTGWANSFTTGQTVKNDAAISVGFASSASAIAGTQFFDNITVEADTKTGLTMGQWRSFAGTPTFTAVNSGTITDGTYTGIRLAPTIASGVTVNTGNVTNVSLGATVGGTVSLYRGIIVAAPSVSGTLTTAYGIDIAAITQATTNAGIRNASPLVETPTAQTISAVGNTINHTARVMELTNSSGGSLTLTSAPTITDGQNGELLTLINVGTQNIVVQDQGTLASSNLRLTATTITLTPRDSVMLRYNSTVGDWVQETAVCAVV